MTVACQINLSGLLGKRKWEAPSGMAFDKAYSDGCPLYGLCFRFGAELTRSKCSHHLLSMSFIL